MNGRGYPFENHKVYTEDGYILEMHRVPGGNYKNKTLADFKGPRPAVLINHGLADSSSAFLFAAANQSLGINYFKISFTLLISFPFTILTFNFF